MRSLDLTVDGETYQAVIRQGLATIHDKDGRLVRVHRIDGGKLPPNPEDPLMAQLVNAIKGTEGGPEYLEACASVRVAREMALADPGSKWRDYEHTWLSAREARECWEEQTTSGLASGPRRRANAGPAQPALAQVASAAGARLPRSSVRRRLVAWGQR